MKTKTFNLLSYLHKPHILDFTNSVLIAFIVVSMAFLLTPIENKWAYNTDEAIEMSRLFHLYRGFTFYTQMWTDHPPGWTWLLYGWSFLFGKSLFSAKMLALLVATSGIIAFYWILILFFDRFSSFFCILLFSSTARFISPISSITIDMPSLSLALIGMSLFLYAMKNNWKWLIFASGVFFGYAMTIKFFTAVIIVTLLGCSKIVSKKIASTIEYKVLGLWLVTIIMTFFLLMLFYFPFPYYHLVEFHRNATPHFGSETLIKLFKRASEKDLIFLLMSPICIFLSLTKFKKDLWRVIIPLVFLGLIMVQFSVQRPIWWTYYPLISLPLCWICGLTFSKSIYFLRNKNKIKFNTLKICLSCFVLLIFSVFIVQSYWNYYVNNALPVANFRHDSPTIQKQELLDNVQKFSANNQWIITDDPLFAVYTEVSIPPELAVFSAKRLVTEKIDDQFFLDIINSYQPEQIVWVRFANFFEEYNLVQSLENLGYESLETPQLNMFHLIKKQLPSSR